MPPPNGINSECMECRDGSVECGEDPCAGGGGALGPWVFRGTAWLPIEQGLDAAIRVYARARFSLDGSNNPIIGPDGLPINTIDVYLDMPLRAGCVHQDKCKDAKDAS